MYLVLMLIGSKQLLWENRRPDGSSRWRMRRRRAAGPGDRAGQLHVSGVWLTRDCPGSRRYAAEIVKAIAARDIWNVVLHVPWNAPTVLPAWTSHPRIEIRRARLPGVPFEQVYLPLVTAGRLLLNLSGSAPLVKRRQLVTIYDAAPFRNPVGHGRTAVMMRLIRYRWLGRLAEGLLTVSEFSAHELSDVLGIPVDRFTVAPGSADSLTGVGPVRPVLPFRGDEYLVIGSVDQHDSIDAAVAAIVASGRKVIVVGLRTRDRHRCATTESDGRVVIAGWLTDEELVWLYRHARAVVYPSTYAGFGLPPLEAQAFGCPVVCSDSAGLPEVCRDGALYCDPGDPHSLIAQLERLDAEGELVETLQRKGLANVSRYSWQDSADRVLRWCRQHHGIGALIC